MSRDATTFAVVCATALAAWVVVALIRHASRVIDDAPYVISDPDELAACVARHPSQVRTYCGRCGARECVCGAGVGDEAEAWLRELPDVPYDHEREGL